MTTIHISKPGRNQEQWMVFGSYEATDGSDRYTFAHAKFGRQEDAERRAKRLMEKYEADHLARS